MKAHLFTSMTIQRLMSFGFVAFMAILLGCTSSSITVYSNMSVPKFERYLIFASTPNPALEKVIEDQFVSIFNQNKINNIPRYILIPISQHIDRTQFYKLMEEYKIDAILILRPVGESQNAPETSLDIPMDSFVLYNREATYLYESSDTWTRRNQKVFAQIIDVKQQRIVWYAYLSTKKWTTTEVALYTKVLASMARDMANSVVNNIGSRTSSSND